MSTYKMNTYGDYISDSYPIHEFCPNCDSTETVREVSDAGFYRDSCMRCDWQADWQPMADEADDLASEPTGRDD